MGQVCTTSPDTLQSQAGAAPLATCDVGIVGLAVMGSNLALNIADKQRFQVAVFNRTWEKTRRFLEENELDAEGLKRTNLHGCRTYAEFARALKKPRKALILVMAGGPTDETIKELSNVFDGGDVIVDTGNAHFRDQTRRAEELEAKGLRFLGMGISGGEEGARKGPAFFPGGTLSVWRDVKDVIEAAAAKAADGRPCAVMNGAGGAGSCVKMFHNAGEYAILQIWGEAYAIMRAWRLPGERQASILNTWKTKKGGGHENLLSSYMLDITVEVVKARDELADDGCPLLGRTMDMIGSKGTGLWSVQEALGVGVPAPSLAAAVIARQMSMCRDERQHNSTAFDFKEQTTECTAELLEDLYWAVALSIIASYAQMFQCLRALDKEFKFGLRLPATIATFRAGCILQGYLLQPMTKAFEDDPHLPNLLTAFKPEVKENLPRFRRLMAEVLQRTSAATPVLSASLEYIQTMITPLLPSAQCVALQRDVFGRHGFKRLDRKGDYNATWPALQ